MRFRTFDYRHAEVVLRSKCRLKTEIQRILSKLELQAQRSPNNSMGESPHRQIQRAFERFGWRAEALVSPLAGAQHRFDLAKQGVAIEIELSTRELLYRDYFRFMLAEAQGILQVGVIVLLDESARRLYPVGVHASFPRLEDVVEDLHCLNGSIPVPIWVIALK
jgi:hypothetical protein